MENNLEKWALNGGVLTYEDSTHTYTFDGTKCASVTQVLQWKFNTKYLGVDEEILKKAAQKGSEVHNAIEMYYQYGFDSPEMPEFRNFLHLMKLHKLKVIDNEKPIVLKFKDMVVAGRLDLVLQNENGEFGLGDIKRTSQLDIEYLTYQLNLYRLGYKQTYGTEISFLKGVHIRNEKRKCVDIKIKEEYILGFLEEYYENVYKKLNEEKEELNNE